ncbi:unnamed protein product [Rangifer tarandus platyrhynchus]|uniref:Uncharacterized protein n=2 Tax=Rangifer tarandus platyrhynchus TaxID=3082113 RepID=A0ACB0EZV9_RANTA|nr:unnamed protein product [Rangifer tarandus platyrhynchus]CAI9706114.1 unnamed protein product [Rangifer tarandus platyrhynchus]
MELTFRAPFSVDRPEEKWLKATCATAGNCTVLGSALNAHVQIRLRTFPPCPGDNYSEPRRTRGARGRTRAHAGRTRGARGRTQASAPCGSARPRPWRHPQPACCRRCSCRSRPAPRLRAAPPRTRRRWSTRMVNEVALAHAGGGSSPRAAAFLLALEPELEARLAHLCVQVKGEDEEENNLGVRETKIKGESGRFSTVKLPVALDPGAKVCHRGSRLYPRASAIPTQIPQSEKQFVVFEGSHYFFSPYPTKTQTTRVKLASRNVESCTKLGNPTRPEDLLGYEPFRDVPAYSQDMFKVLKAFQQHQWHGDLRRGLLGAALHSAGL